MSRIVLTVFLELLHSGHFNNDLRGAFSEMHRVRMF